MMNNKGAVPFLIVPLLFKIGFAGIAVVAIAHIPARQVLKTKLIDKCVSEGSQDRSACKHFIDGLTQRERVAINEGKVMMIYTPSK